MDVAAAEARVRVRAGGPTRSPSAAFFPQIDASGNGQRSGSGGPNRGSGVVSTNRGRDRRRRPEGLATALYSAGLDASWELDVFGGLRREAQAARRRSRGQPGRSALKRARVAGRQSCMAPVLRRRPRDSGAAAHCRGEPDLAATDLRSDQLRAREAGSGRTSTSSRPARSSRRRAPPCRPAHRPGGRRTGSRCCWARVARSGRAAARDEPKPIPVTPEKSPSRVPADTLAQRRGRAAAPEMQLVAQNARVGVATADAYPKLRALGSIGVEALTVGGLFPLAKAGAWDARRRDRRTIFHGGAVQGRGSWRRTRCACRPSPATSRPCSAPRSRRSRTRWSRTPRSRTAAARAGRGRRRGRARH